LLAKSLLPVKVGISSTMIQSHNSQSDDPGTGSRTTMPIANQYIIHSSCLGASLPHLDSGLTNSILREISQGCKVQQRLRTKTTNLVRHGNIYVNLPPSL